MKRKSLDIVRHVYDEETGEPLDRLIEQDDALHDEYVALREMKALMDARPRQRPRAQTLRTVQEAARNQTSGRRDRLPVRSAVRLYPVARLVAWARPVSYAAAACVLLVVGYWFGARSTVPQTAGLPGPVAAESKGQESPQTPTIADFLAESEFAASDEMLAEQEEVMGLLRNGEIMQWDNMDDLMLIQWRVEALEENISGSSWDRAVPLEGFQPVDTRAQAGDDVLPDTAGRWIYR